MRQDADDISYADRMEKQVQYLAEKKKGRIVQYAAAQHLEMCVLGIGSAAGKTSEQ